jgi:hypothetical protein
MYCQSARQPAWMLGPQVITNQVLYQLSYTGIPKFLCR